MNRGQAREPARRVPPRVLLWIPEILFLTVTTAAGLWARGRWLDPSGDVGIWWSLGDRLAHGQRYYRDIYLQYGPLSPWLLSGAARLFGSSAAAFLLVHWIAAIVAGILLLRLSRNLLSTVERIALVGFLLGLSVLAPGTGRLVLSYCPAAVHAVVFSLGAFLIMPSWSEGRWRPYVAGALAGLALCAKQEIGLAAMMGLGAPILTTPRKGLRWFLQCLAGFLIVAAIGVGFIIMSGASFDSLRYDSHLWPISSIPPQWRSLFRGVAGMSTVDFPRAVFVSLLELLKVALLVSLLGLLLARERRGRYWWPTLALTALLFAADLFSGGDLLPHLRPAILLMIVAFLVSLRAFLGGPRPERELLMGLGLFAGLLGLRTAFSADVAGPYTGVGHFAEALTWVVFLAAILPDILPGGGMAARRTRQVWVLILLPIAWWGAFEGIQTLGTSGRLAVETPRGRVWVGSRMASIFTEIRRELRPSESVLFLPETNAVDVLFGLRDASPYLIHLPGWLTARAEASLISRFQKQPPDAVVVFERPTGEFRIKPFGEGFGLDLANWIDRNYRVVAAPRGAKILRLNQSAGESSLLEHESRLAGDQPHRGAHEPLEAKKHRKRPRGDDPSKPDASRQQVQKRGVVSRRAQSELGKLPLEAIAVSLKDDPGLRNVGPRESVAGSKAPLGSALVIWLGREEPVEPFPEGRVRRLDQYGASSRSQYADGFSEKRPRVGQVVKDVQHQEGGDGSIREVQFLGRHDAVQMGLGIEVRRDDFRTDLLDETAARSDLDHRPLRDPVEGSHQLSIVLAIETFEKWF